MFPSILRHELTLSPFYTSPDFSTPDFRDWGGYIAFAASTYNASCSQIEKQFFDAVTCDHVQYLRGI